MNKVVVLYWEPGSCGDFVQRCLLSNSNEYKGIIKRFVTNSSGRTVPEDIEIYFKENLHCENNLWYEIDWDDVNIEKLVRYIKQNNISQFLVPTHRFEQVARIKHQLSNVLTVGITYPENMFPLVLKNWCKKTTANDAVLQGIYNKPLHKNLVKNGLFGEYILSEQLKFGSEIPQSVEQQFDVNISLESLFAGDLTSIKSLLTDSAHVDFMFNGWFTHQSDLHKYQHGLLPELKQSLGFNSLATKITDKDIELDIFDNILINHYSGSNLQLPTFKTLSQAQLFFKDSA